jgi:hypothetical protein
MALIYIYYRYSCLVAATQRVALHDNAATDTGLREIEVRGNDAQAGARSRAQKMMLVIVSFRAGANCRPKLAAIRPK